MNQPGYLRYTPEKFVNTAFKYLILEPAPKVVGWVNNFIFRMAPSTCLYKDLLLQNTKMLLSSTSSTNDQ